MVINDTNSIVLSIQGSGTGETLSWPLWASDFMLERATNLSPPIFWAVVSNGIATNGGYMTFMFTNAPAAPALYFRLRSQ